MDFGPILSIHTSMGFAGQGNIGTEGTSAVDSTVNDPAAPPPAPLNMTQGSSDVTISAIAIRSLFPFVALVLLLGTFIWGPWVTLGATYLWWRIVGRLG